MFDIGIGFSELMLLAVIMIIVVGPEELPSLLRTIGRYIGQVKRVADDFRNQVNEVIEETDVDKIKDDIVDEVGLDMDDPFGEDLIDFEEHNQKVLDKEKRDRQETGEDNVPEHESATERALREAGVAGLPVAKAVEGAEDQEKEDPVAAANRNSAEYRFEMSGDDFADERKEDAPKAAAGGKSGA